VICWIIHHCLSICQVTSANGMVRPLYPRKRTCAVQLGMSALGQKRTWGARGKIDSVPLNSMSKSRDRPRLAAGPLTMSTLSEQAIGPSQRMENLLAGHYSAQCVHVIAVLGIPDLLANGHTTVESLASAAHCDPPSLRRVLRMLVRLGLFTESAQDQFQLTPLGATLRSDVADSMRDRAIAQVELWRRA
jgi:hypothetical protein